MPYRMKVIGTGRVIFDRPAYLKRYDVDANFGMGAAELTRDPKDALTWPNMESLLEAWKTRSRVQPTRDDGRPNRPLAAFTVEPERAD